MGGHLVFELLYCLQITAKEDPDWMDLALAHFANDTGSGPGLWLWSWHPGLALALAWICLGPTSPNWVNVCPGGDGTVPKGGPA